jgi:hypothetical protein
MKCISVQSGVLWTVNLRSRAWLVAGTPPPQGSRREASSGFLGPMLCMVMLS